MQIGEPRSPAGDELLEAVDVHRARRHRRLELGVEQLARHGQRALVDDFSEQTPNDRLVVRHCFLLVCDVWCNMCATAIVRYPN